MDEHSSGNSIISLIVLVAIVWICWSFFFKENKSEPIDQYTPTATFDGKVCPIPSNPYDEGSGHYAGFEWGEEGNDCAGNSDSFIEGCYDYFEQEEALESCMDAE